MPKFLAELKFADSQMSVDWDDAIDFGRQRSSEPRPLSLIAAGDSPRVVIAAAQDVTVSRNHLRIEALGPHEVNISNCSNTCTIVLDSGQRLEPRTSMHQVLPLKLNISGCQIAITSSLAKSKNSAGTTAAFTETPQTTAPDSMAVLTLDHEAPRPGQSEYPSIALASKDDSQSAESAKFIEWLSLAMNVLQSAANESDFLEKAARTAIDIVDLDTVAVMMLENGTWTNRATCRQSANQFGGHWTPSQTILDQVRSRTRTVRHLPKSDESVMSLMGVQALVAAPILDRDGGVVGAVYGDRRLGSQSSQPNITELEAVLVELLASGVAAGLARVEQERAAMEVRVHFERFFTPSLARYLIERPELLEGRDAEVSVMFCDIRGFSRMSERLGPAQTMRMIGDVMDQLSEVVFAEDGVLVDYIGDELIAMWGAPEDQADHAMRALRAGIAMQDRMPQISQQWHDLIGEPIQIGIGVCSGPAHVGNTGSRKKFKYGPLGNTVNLASRIQGATKHFGVNFLVSAETISAADNSILSRRLSEVRVVNIAQPLALYEVATRGNCEQPHWKAYGAALEAFESGKMSDAREVLESGVMDGPARALLARIESRAGGPSNSEDSVWDLPNK